MINKKSVIAIIPARGGSKGLKNKNIKHLCGKPLIAWTIEKAKLSKYIDTVLVTTDDPKIAGIAKDFGAEVPFLRPKNISKDSSPTFDAVMHAISFYKDKNMNYDYIVLLEPTSPLREDSDIDNILKKLDDSKVNYDAIVSVGEIGEHPSIVKKIINQKIEPFEKSLEQKSRRQDNVPAYFPYGVAYIVKTKTFYEEKSFYTKRCNFFEIKRYQNYEIDDIYDFLCVENVMKYEWGTK